MTYTTKKLHIWTDGACKGNPGPGGWGVLMVWGDVRKELYGGEVSTTNNQMELTAVITALKSIKRSCPVVIHTDSAYVKNGITTWIAKWRENGWMTSNRKPVKNVQLWRELHHLNLLFSPNGFGLRATPEIPAMNAPTSWQTWALKQHWPVKAALFSHTVRKNEKAPIRGFSAIAVQGRTS